MYRIFSFFKLKKFRLALLAAIAAAVLLFGLTGAAVNVGNKKAAPADSLDLPIIMYHSAVKDSRHEGDYVITVKELEKDFQYICSLGYTPVFCSEVSDFVNGRGSLPEKPIIISFDDGSYNNFYYVTPLLEKYHLKAVFSIVGKWCETAAEEAEPSTVYSYADLDNLTSMINSGCCEIANHTYDLHSLDGRKGVLRLDGEDNRSYRVALYNDITMCQRLLERVGERPKVFAYPYGFCDDESEEILSQLGFEVSLGCEEKINEIAVGDYECLKQMGRFNRAASADREDFFDRLTR